jgi:hypothetical protein
MRLLQKAMEVENSLMKSEESTNSFSNRATRLVASVFGILVGLAGIEHGIFEMLQGNVPTNGIVIDAIGDSFTFWEGTGERAVSILPTFLLAGISSAILGIVVIVWSSFFVQRKFGATILLVLTFALFLVGGGMAPIVLSITAVAAATRIDKPLGWWKTHLSLSLRKSLGKLWPWALAIFVVIFWSTMAVQIFGLPLETTLISMIVGLLSIVMVVLIPVSVIVGLAYDATR